jgi:tetratricopeptide (TPR) repeat protein
VPEISETEPISEKRLLLFKALTLIIPFFLLTVLECGLRLSGYGHDTSLFVEDPGRKGYLVMNQFASQKYFSVQENATIGNFEPFPEHKAPGTFRIFVLGESTTIGYPYMHNGSFHRWLQFRLMHTFPDRDFEVINLSLTAVNSYTVFDFAKELVDKEPDAVLIYTGHNEYYGAAGVGSTSSFAHNPSLMRVIFKLREFRLVQLIYSAINSVSGLFSSRGPNLRENLMKRMAANQQIAFKSDVYEAGIDQFKTNMNDLCQLLSSKRIPVLISNLVSNEKDLKPFISEKGIAKTSADAHYQSGNQFLSHGDFRKAKSEFVQAKELDLLRFRAPAAMNVVIAEIASKYPGVTLVDTKSLFEKFSEHGILGKQTLLEHVHPNLFGYSLLSESFYQAMKISKLISVANITEIPITELRRQMPVTAVDSLKGEYEMMILKEGWPFNVPMPAEEKRPKTFEEELAGALVVKQISWRAAMNQLQNHYIKQQDTVRTLQVTEALLLENPYEFPLYDKAGKLCLSLNKNNDAVTYLSKAFRMENNFERAQQLFITLLKMDKPREALVFLGYAAANNQSKFSLDELHAFVKQLVVVKERFEKDSTNVELSNQLAAGYLKFANVAGANKYVDKSLQLDPKNRIALLMKEQIQLMSR